MKKALGENQTQMQGLQSESTKAQEQQSRLREQLTASQQQLSKQLQSVSDTKQQHERDVNLLKEKDAAFIALQQAHSSSKAQKEKLLAETQAQLRDRDAALVKVQGQLEATTQNNNEHKMQNEARTKEITVKSEIIRSQNSALTALQTQIAQINLQLRQKQQKASASWSCSDYSHDDDDFSFFLARGTFDSAN